MLHHILIFSIIFLSSFGIEGPFQLHAFGTTETQENCDLGRYPSPIAYATALEAPLPSLKHKIADKYRTLEDAERELLIGEWSTTFKQSIETDNIVGENYGYTPNSSSSIELSRSLNLNKIRLKQKLLQTKRELTQLSLNSLLREDAATKLSLIIDLHEASNLDQILRERLSVNNRLDDYYMSRRDSGESNIEEELKVRSDILVIKDQLLANSIKRASTLDELGITVEPWMPNFFDKQQFPKFNSHCAFQTFEFLVIEKQIEIAELELNELRIENNYSLNFTVEMKSNRSGKGVTEEEASAKINFVLPISDGGKRKSDQLAKTSELQSQTTKLRDLKGSQARSENAYRSKERLFFSSLNSIQNDMHGIRKRMDELNERKNLGQTVFLERSNLELEKSRLAESNLRLVSDLHQEWYKFLIDKISINTRQKDH